MPKTRPAYPTESAARWSSGSWREGRQPNELLRNLRSHTLVLGAGKSLALYVGEGQEDLDHMVQHHEVHSVGEGRREGLRICRYRAKTLLPFRSQGV